MNFEMQSHHGLQKYFECIRQIYRKLDDEISEFVLFEYHQKDGDHSQKWISL